MMTDNEKKKITFQGTEYLVHRFRILGTTAIHYEGHEISVGGYASQSHSSLLSDDQGTVWGKIGSRRPVGHTKLPPGKREAFVRQHYRDMKSLEQTVILQAFPEATEGYPDDMGGVYLYA